MKSLKTELGRDLVKRLAEPIAAQLAPDEASAYGELAEIYLRDPQLSREEPLSSGLGLLPDLVIVLCAVATTVDRLVQSGRITLPGLQSRFNPREDMAGGASGLEIDPVEQALDQGLDQLSLVSRKAGWNRQRLEALLALVRARLVERVKVPILFLGSSPDQVAALRVDRELREVQEAIRGSAFAERIELESNLATRIADLQRTLLDHRPRILHFAGHGSRAGGILLEGEHGEARNVSAERLSLLLDSFSHHVRCVVLNACYSASQAAGIAERIDFVVGMSEKVGDDSAISFSKAFYRGLANGVSLKQAVDLGRSQIDLAGGQQKADLPLLLALRSDPGQAFFLPG